MCHSPKCRTEPADPWAAPFESLPIHAAYTAAGRTVACLLILGPERVSWLLEDEQLASCLAHLFFCCVDVVSQDAFLAENGVETLTAALADSLGGPAAKPAAEVSKHLLESFLTVHWLLAGWVLTICLLTADSSAWQGGRDLEAVETQAAVLGMLLTFWDRGEARRWLHWCLLQVCHGPRCFSRYKCQFVPAAGLCSPAAAHCLQLPTACSCRRTARVALHGSEQPALCHAVREVPLGALLRQQRPPPWAAPAVLSAVDSLEDLFQGRLGDIDQPWLGQAVALFCTCHASWVLLGGEAGSVEGQQLTPDRVEALSALAAKVGRWLMHHGARPPCGLCLRAVAQGRSIVGLLKFWVELQPCETFK